MTDEVRMPKRVRSSLGANRMWAFFIASSLAVVLSAGGDSKSVTEQLALACFGFSLVGSGALSLRSPKHLWTFYPNWAQPWTIWYPTAVVVSFAAAIVLAYWSIGAWLAVSLLASFILAGAWAIAMAKADGSPETKKNEAEMLKWVKEQIESGAHSPL